MSNASVYLLFSSQAAILGLSLHKSTNNPWQSLITFFPASNATSLFLAWELIVQNFR